MFSTLLQHVQKSKFGMLDGVMAEIETLLARGKMDLPISLIFAAQKGDDIMLHELLKKGSDPNEIDNKTGKTALVRILFPLMFRHLFFFYMLYY